MIKTRGLSRVALAVCDPERSMRFYQQLVGAIAVYREPESRRPRAMPHLAFL
jgi:catechol 2,3-dioxygenase-like lactoylglutathione lyase family enzyme